MIFVDDLRRPSWRCIHFVSQDDELPDHEALNDAGIANVELDIVGLEDDVTLLRALARALSFPSYFGENWDALDECLRDLEWLPARGYLLTVSGATSLWRRKPATMGHLLESWLFAAEDWARKDISFHLVIRLDSTTTKETAVRLGSGLDGFLEQ